MNSESILRQVDQSAIKVNQASIVGLLVIAFVVDSAALAGFVAVVMLLGTLEPRFALFQALYRGVLRPAGLVRPYVHVDNPEPHRFAQGMGGTVLALGTALLLLGSAAGWALVLLVAALASVNLLFGFGVPGFRRRSQRAG